MEQIETVTRREDSEEIYRVNKFSEDSVTGLHQKKKYRIFNDSVFITKLNLHINELNHIKQVLKKAADKAF